MSDLLGAIPLVLEVSRLGIPFVDFVRNGIKGHDLLHEQGGDAGSKETYQDVVIGDAGTGGVALKGQDIALERRGVLPVLLGHAVGGQPGDGIPSCVLMFKRCLELLEKVVPGSEGNGSAVDGVFSEGICPG